MIIQQEVAEEPPAAQLEIELPAVKPRTSAMAIVALALSLSLLSVTNLPRIVILVGLAIGLLASLLALLRAFIDRRELRKRTWVVVSLAVASAFVIVVSACDYLFP